MLHACFRKAACVYAPVSKPLEDAWHAQKRSLGVRLNIDRSSQSNQLRLRVGYYVSSRLVSRDTWEHERTRKERDARSSSCHLSTAEAPRRGRIDDSSWLIGSNASTTSWRQLVPFLQQEIWNFRRVPYAYREECDRLINRLYLDCNN